MTQIAGTSEIEHTLLDMGNPGGKIIVNRRTDACRPGCGPAVVKFPPTERI